MNIAREDCIWYEQCRSEYCGICKDYSPADESEQNENFYHNVLLENARRYQNLIQSYLDRGDYFES